MVEALVWIENEQDKLEFSPQLGEIIQKVVDTVLAQEEFLSECEVSVLITDNENIRMLNAEHRGKDTATDVLSFPMLEFDDAGRVIRSEADTVAGGLMLGDIVISLERAAEQADEYGHSLEREVGFLTAHSVLHLLGYDHETGETARELMRHKEERALGAIGLQR